MESDMDFANYGRMRSKGFSSSESVAAIKLSKVIKQQERKRK